MYEYFQAEREMKKSMTKDQKLAVKEEKLALEEQYGICYLDGRKEKVGNFRIEPPGLFRGRGKHPKTGCLKVCFLHVLDVSPLRFCTTDEILTNSLVPLNPYIAASPA